MDARSLRRGHGGLGPLVRPTLRGGLDKPSTQNVRIWPATRAKTKGSVGMERWKWVAPLSCMHYE